MFVLNKQEQPPQKPWLDRSLGNLAKIGAKTVGVIVTFVAAIMGSLFGVLFLEPFKADQELRKFAISEIYTPMKQKEVECLNIQRDILTAEKTAFLTIRMGRAAFNRFVVQREGVSGLSVSAEVAQVAVKPWSDAMMKGNEARTRLLGCMADLGNQRRELATVLGITEKFDELDSQLRKKRPKDFYFSDIKNSKVTEYVNEPDKLMAFIQAAIDGTQGNALRGAAAIERASAVLKSMEDGHLAVAIRQEQLVSVTIQEDNQMNTMFLAKLRELFERKPTSYLPRWVNTILN